MGYTNVSEPSIPNNDNADRSDGVEGILKGWKGVREGKVEREDNSRGRVIIDRAAGAPPMISTHEFSFALGELPFLGAIQVSRREREREREERGGNGTYRDRAFFHECRETAAIEGDIKSGKRRQMIDHMGSASERA